VKKLGDRSRELAFFLSLTSAFIGKKDGTKKTLTVGISHTSSFF
jgi:hypothetical protein